MNLKNIDFKQLLLQKGERLALYVCGGIAGLLIILGAVWKGVGSGSPSENAKRLEELRKQAENKMQQSRPDDSLGVVDAFLREASNPKEIDPLQYATSRPLFQTTSNEDVSWRKPEVLAPDLFVAQGVRGLVRQYAIDLENRQAWVLKHKSREASKPNNKLVE